MPEHQLTHDPENDRYFCSACGVTYHKPELKTRCIGVTLYQWGEWPEHLLTKLQMNEAGFQTGKKLPPPTGAVWRDKSPNGIMYLYDRAQGVPKKPISDEQRAKLAEAAKKSQAMWYCERCGQNLGYHERGGLCESCNGHVSAVAWAEQMFSEGFVILDVKTTGLSVLHDEVIQIAVIDHHGAVLLDTLVKPIEPQRMFRKVRGDVSAFDVTQIRPEQLGNAPMFSKILPELQTVTENRHCLIYNPDFDYYIIRNECLRRGLPEPEFLNWHSVMGHYMGWCRTDGAWISLPGGGFTAIDDCVAILEVMHRMMYGIEQRNEE